MAEGVLRAELQLRGLGGKVSVESAGTAALLGHSVDGRAQLVCARESIKLRKSPAMDQRNLHWLLEYCPASHRERISCLASWAVQGQIDDIPDPYFGSLAGFEQVLLTLHLCIDGFLLHLLERLKQFK
jgi:protein-tyrosine phosphatase